MHSVSRANVTRIKACRTRIDPRTGSLTRYLVPTHTISIYKRALTHAVAPRTNREGPTMTRTHVQSTRRANEERARGKKKERWYSQPRVFRFQWCRRVKSTSPTGYVATCESSVTSYQSQLPHVHVVLNCLETVVTVSRNSNINGNRELPFKPSLPHTARGYISHLNLMTMANLTNRFDQLA